MSTLPLSFFHTRSRGHIAVSDMVNNNDGWAMLRWAAWLPSFPFFTKEAGPHHHQWRGGQQMTHDNHKRQTMLRWAISPPSFPLSFFHTRISGHVADGGMKCDNGWTTKNGDNKPWLPNGKWQPPTMSPNHFCWFVRSSNWYITIVLHVSVQYSNTKQRFWCW